MEVVIQLWLQEEICNYIESLYRKELEERFENKATPSYRHAVSVSYCLSMLDVELKVSQLRDYSGYFIYKGTVSLDIPVALKAFIEQDSKVPVPLPV